MKNGPEFSQCSNCNQFCINLSGLANHDLLDLDANKRELWYQKGESLFKQSSFVSNIVYIKHGLVKLVLEGTSDKNTIIRFAKPGDFIGISALYSNNFYPYTAISLKKTQVCLIEKNHINDLTTRFPELAVQMIKLYTDELNFLYKKLLINSTKQLHGRLAEAILYLSDTQLQAEEIYSCITRKDLAELSAMSPESMIRLLNEFRNDKIINLEGKSIEINDIGLLVKLSQAG